MQDRELLELAAKAIGGTLSEGHTKVRTGETWDTWEWQGALGIQTGADWTPYPGTTIHPLIDDGDALRLAVKLNMCLKHHYFDGDWYVMVSHENGWSQEKVGPDQYAATRRAIVRSAAKTGGAA
jgi:hypothetical protein